MIVLDTDHLSVLKYHDSSLSQMLEGGWPCLSDLNNLGCATASESLEKQC